MEDTQMANKHMKGYHISYVIREMKIMRYCCASIRMAMIWTLTAANAGENVGKE